MVERSGAIVDKHAVLHQRDSRFSFPLDRTRALIRLRTRRDDAILRVTALWNTSHLFWKEQLRCDMAVKHRDELFDYYECVLDNGCPGYSYLFEILDDEGQALYYNESGFNDRLRLDEAYTDNFVVVFPNDNDIARPNPAFEGRVFYQIFPERFRRSADKPYADYIDQAWDTEDPVNHRFMGGDLPGVTEKLPYLKELGIGAVYMTPIHPSASAHKYDVDDYFDVDRMFGSLQDLKALVERAHSLDIKVVLDLVFNHSSAGHPFFQDVVKNGRASRYYDWYFVDGDKPVQDSRNYLSFCDVAVMPKLNTNNRAVQEYLTEVGLFYLEQYAIDGFRLDVAFDVSHEFWRFFKARLKAVNPAVFIIGEDWQNCEAFLGPDQWDSVMNYPFRYACQRFFATGRYSPRAFSDYLNSVLVRYRDGTNRMLVNLLDSHDTERFFETVHHDRNVYVAALATLLFYQGCPMLYYGDEIFMDGKHDPYNRKGMRWDSPAFNSPEHQVIRELLAFRQREALIMGDIQIFERDGLVYLSRRSAGDALTLVINHSGKALPLSSGAVVYARRLEGKLLGNDGFAILSE